MKTPTILEIKKNAKNNPKFFSENTLQFFNQTLQDFHIKKTKCPYVFYFWANIVNEDNAVAGKSERYYNAKNCKIYLNINDAIEGE